MEIFLDSASITELEHVIKWGIIDGVTTNQKIFLKEKGVNFKDRILDICKIMGSKPVSVESNGITTDEIVNDARTYAKLAPNVVPKVPMLADGSGLEAVSILSQEKIPTNVTVMMNLNQLNVSLFYNRAKDSGEDPVKIIQEYVKWVSRNNLSTKLIAGSIRHIKDVEDKQVLIL
jgi:transaldolase